MRRSKKARILSAVLALMTMVCMAVPAFAATGVTSVRQDIDRFYRSNRQSHKYDALAPAPKVGRKFTGNDGVTYVCIGSKASPHADFSPDGGEAGIHYKKGHAWYYWCETG